MANAVTATLLFLVAAATAIPVRYDQRQDGDWNVDARLQNFFVVFSPKGINSPTGGINILDIASKAIPIRPGSGLAAAAAAAAAAAGGTPNAAASDPQDRQGQAGDAPELVLVPAGRSAIPTFAVAAAPDAGAIPMLVAVPVPEVAPLPGSAFVSAVPLQPAISPSHIEPHPQQSALLPMLSVIKPGTSDKIIPVQSIPAEAIPATIQSEKAPVSSESAPNPSPIQQAAPEQQATLAQAAAPVAAEKPAQPAAAAEQDKVLRLIGTGIEDCGPSRIRNEQGVCVADRS